MNCLSLFLLLSCLFPDTEDASETDLAKHDEDDYVEIKEQYVVVIKCCNKTVNRKMMK